MKHRIEANNFIELLELNLKPKKCVEIESSEAIVVGDIHADVETLREIISKDAKCYIFLGDYADRGEYPVETYFEILRLMNESYVVMLRGNHESGNVYPHDLPYHIKSYFGEFAEEILEKISELWSKLPVCACREDYFFVHGGIPTMGRKYFEEFSEEMIKNPDDDAVMEMLWNDPWEKDENGLNYQRGRYYFFGMRTTRAFLDQLEFKVIVRGHEPFKILRAEQKGMVVTVGSSKLYPNAAYLEIDFMESIDDGFDVVRKFGRHVYLFP
ncbi:hypothetical protein Asulf_01635 [Archaeoglobus sulfaticallidus PM70-1]|uniref:Serine/threonine specific protein phosphatases domain-containing protein n=1 Tax=Archaeoglobus sulfaticallidus PM70-1 TaxID=387631 RepID=N0BMW3_9EURY|nr:metallophosphoesterase family protein [Archaeoglobus sulfaticallidus]AGK61610.1 hypothetical protein Asulf_01635 [Archaeoglobus sulfaticallidus PM70-1]